LVALNRFWNSKGAAVDQAALMQNLSAAIFGAGNISCYLN
jgi:hypothetical protein